MFFQGIKVYTSVDVSGLIIFSPPYLLDNEMTVESELASDYTSKSNAKNQLTAAF